MLWCVWLHWLQVSGRTTVEHLILEREVSLAITSMLSTHGVKPTLATLKKLRLPNDQCQQRIEADLRWLSRKQRSR
eukprot:m.111173 g.111173  ORF g.111173 m.111173 type:complete len:76 (-) comp10743_c1_seq2:39-266(-)